MSAQAVETVSAYDELCTLLKEAATLGSVGSLLGWEQETYMPRAAGEHRAEQMALISGLVHDRVTSARIGELIGACEADDDVVGEPVSESAANVREMRRDYDRETKLPKSLVEELARVGSLAQEAWKEARAASDFARFAPLLERMVGLVKQKAQCWGVPKGGELYDALLDEYEPGMRAATLDAIFSPLRKRLSALIAQVGAAGGAPDSTVLELDIPPAKQEAFARSVLEAMRFDLNAGRLDRSAHPFCSGIAPGDTRLTFRYAKEGFLEPLYGVMHEAGHGLYEQGLPKADKFGQPLSQAISLGIHESQSRMWENFVGRSRDFWEWAFPKARAAIGPIMDQFDAQTMYRAANIVKPSFIRVEADEATYNLHVMLRFSIERAMLRGDLAVKDIPAAWNAQFEQMFGLKVPDDRRGCLQDVHWSFGAIGYFPTYTLGNLYAAQLWETINAQIPDLGKRIARGDFAALKAWLNTNIHVHGRRYRAAELCQMLTGKPLSADPLMRHLEGKLRPIYGI